MQAVCQERRALLYMLFNLKGHADIISFLKVSNDFTEFRYLFSNIGWLNNITLDHIWKAKAWSIILP